MTLQVFGDGFDLYATPADMLAGWWDAGSSAPPGQPFAPGRFGGQAYSGGNGNPIFRTSGLNHTNHHFNFAILDTQGIQPPGTGSLWGYIVLYDGTTAQCSIILRQDGYMLFCQGSGGTILATLPFAVAQSNVWYGFECEVVLGASNGSFALRKSGNANNDVSASGLAIAPSGNVQANRIGLVFNVGSSALYYDDFLWRSDTASVPWAGEIRCYVRRPVSDQSVAWTPSASVVACGTPPSYPQTTPLGMTAGQAYYCPVTPTCSGTVGSVTLTLNTGYTGNMKCTLFADNGTGTPNTASGAPGSVIGSATALSNPIAGANTLTFSSPPSVTAGTLYWLGFCSDTGSPGKWAVTAAGQNPPAYPAQWSAFAYNSPTYASFPVANPTGLTTYTDNVIFSLNVTPSGVANAPLVGECVEDQSQTYVSSSTVTQADLYGLTTVVGSTPSNVVGVVTRGFCQKSDVGTRNVALNLKSGSTNSSGTSTALPTSFTWLSRVDMVDPATSTPWTASGVDSLQIGQSLTA